MKKITRRIALMLTMVCVSIILSACTADDVGRSAKNIFIWIFNLIISIIFMIIDLVIKIIYEIINLI